MDCYDKKITLFPPNGSTVAYQASMSSLRPSSILKASMGGRKKVECYRSLFAIEGKMGTTNQCSCISVASECPDVFRKDLPLSWFPEHNLFLLHLIAWHL